MCEVNLVSPEEFLYYSKQVSLQDIGIHGQQKLNAARVVCIGAGGLGCPALQYLAAMGIGNILIVDGDRVDYSNLHRQILYTPDDIGLNKATIAKKRLLAINPNIKIETIISMLTIDNAESIISAADIVIDCSDNFATRYLVNDVCRMLSTPYVYAAITEFDGSISVFCTEDGPCYRCLFPEPPASGSVKNCAEAGVVGVLPGLLGVMQANEVMKWILGMGNLLIGRYLTISALDMIVKTYSFKQSSYCQLCASDSISVKSLQLVPHDICKSEIAPEESMSVEQFSGVFDQDNIYLIDVREPHEYAYFHVNAHLIPLGLLKDNLINIPKDKTIIVICHSGFRSQKAASMLREHLKINNIYSLQGGMLAWARYKTSGCKA